jgi:signal peptidase II
MVVEALPAIIAARALWAGGLSPVRHSFLALAIVLVDQATKYWVRLALPIGVPKPVIPGIVYFTHVENTGAAFGLLRGYTPLLILITAIVLIVTYANRSALAQERPVFRLGYSLGVAGAIGNFIDRLIFGRVTDFIDFRFWPVFNLADTSIFFGALLLCWGIFTDRERTGEKEPPPADE